MARDALEDWGQTLGIGLLAATLPVMAGWTVRLFWAPIAQAVSGSGATETFQARAESLTPWVVLVCGPVIVFLLAGCAGVLTRHSPMLRATVVGLAPGALMVSVLAARGSFAAQGGRGSLGLRCPSTPWSPPAAAVSDAPDRPLTGLQPSGRSRAA